MEYLEERASPPSACQLESLFCHLKIWTSRKRTRRFVDGLQDDILTKLAKIGDLKVISRTSVMEYRGKRNLASDRK